MDIEDKQVIEWQKLKIKKLEEQIKELKFINSELVKLQLSNN